MLSILCINKSTFTMKKRPKKKNTEILQQLLIEKTVERAINQALQNDFQKNDAFLYLEKMKKIAQKEETSEHIKNKLEKKKAKLNRLTNEFKSEELYLEQKLKSISPKNAKKHKKKLKEIEEKINKIKKLENDVQLLAEKNVIHQIELLKKKTKIAKKFNKCHVCQKGKANGVTLKKCSLCKAVCYCSKVCQKKDWRRNHKKICEKNKKIQKEYSNFVTAPLEDSTNNAQNFANLLQLILEVQFEKFQ